MGAMWVLITSLSLEPISGARWLDRTIRRRTWYSPENIFQSTARTAERDGNCDRRRDREGTSTSQSTGNGRGGNQPGPSNSK